VRDVPLTPHDLAYGRHLVALGLASDDVLRAEAHSALASGADLRTHLLRAGRVTPEQDARVCAALTGRKPSDPAASKDLNASGRRLVGLPRPGGTLAGYTIERELARGGAGAVFVARDPAGKPAALKVLLAGWRGGVHAERFRREAELGLRLDHPGIVRVLDHGEEGGQGWLAMELLDGAQPMDEHAKARGLDARARVGLVAQACDAIQHAHEHGAIHRDLKPQNLLVLPDGRVKVVDLGLARLVDEERLTQSGATMGTIEYMAPEQVKGDTAHADARTDVYALGVVLFELLAGRVPFTGDTSVEVMRRILEEPTPDLERLVGGLPRGLAQVVCMATAKEPDARHPTAVALGRELAAVLAGKGDSTAGYGRARSASAGRRRRALAALCAAAALIVAGAAAALEGRARAREADAVARLSSILARSDDALASTRPLGDDGPALLLALREDLDAARATGVLGAADLDAATARIAALEGLVALAAGDRAGALDALQRAGTLPAADPLAAAVAATGSDTAGAARGVAALHSLIGSTGRPELRVWRGLGLTSSQAALDAPDARRALADLDVAPAPLAATPEVRVARARCLATLGRADEASAALADLAVPPDLAWLLVLTAVERALAEAEVAPLGAALATAPPGAPPAALAARVAAATARLRRLLAPHVPRLRAAPDDAQARDLLLAGVRAHARLEPAVPPPRAEIDALVDSACGFRGTGDVETAIAVAALAPADYGVQRSVALLGDRQRSAWRKSQCLPAMRRALELAPERERAELGMRFCALLAFTDQNEECLAACERFLPLATDDDSRSVIFSARGRARRNLGRSDLAEVDFTEAMRLAPLDPKLQYERALARYALKDWPRALDDAAEAATRLPDSGSIESDRLIAITWELGRPARDPRVREVVDKIVEGRPNYAGWWVRRALLQLEVGERDGALASLAKALEWFPRADDANVRPLGPECAGARAALEEGAPDATARVEALVERLEGMRRAAKTREVNATP
jgi:serine/threonine protein kinase